MVYLNYINIPIKKCSINMERYFRNEQKKSSLNDKWDLESTNSNLNGIKTALHP